MKMHSISVVTVCLNAKKTIRRCIESVLQQRLTCDVEYIVVDGGSTDGTLELINEYKEEINQIISEPDEGISDAFNKGIGFCSGTLVGLLNADDYYENDALGKVLGYVHFKFRNSFQTEEFVVYGKIRMFNDTRHKTHAVKPLGQLRYHLPFYHPSCFISGSLYKKFRYNIDYKIAMDYDLISRMYAQGVNFYYTDVLIANMYTGGVSNKNAFQGFREVRNASVKNLKVHPLLAYFFFLYRCGLLALIKTKHRLSE